MIEEVSRVKVLNGEVQNLRHPAIRLEAGQVLETVITKGLPNAFENPAAVTTIGPAASISTGVMADPQLAQGSVSGFHYPAFRIGIQSTGAGSAGRITLNLTYATGLGVTQDTFIVNPSGLYETTVYVLPVNIMDGYSVYSPINIQAASALTGSLIRNLTVIGVAGYTYTVEVMNHENGTMGEFFAGYFGYNY